MYDLQASNSSAYIDKALFADWLTACKMLGLNQTQAMIMAVTIYRSSPPWGDGVAESGDRPKSPNLHIAVPGIIGLWIMQIQHSMTVNRLAKNNTIKATKSDVFRAVLVNFINRVNDNTLLSGK